MKAIPLVLDTDIGDDIDDALALALILNSPEIELCGVTTVFRDAPRRTLLVREILRLWQRDEIPVAAGASKPLLEDLDSLARGGAQLGKQFEALDANSKYKGGIHAVALLAQQIQNATQRGERLTIAAIGPLTSIALLFALHPDLISQCDLLLMGGKWSERFAEWNIACDPEAAAMVFRSGAKITMVGLDVTLRCVLSDEQTARFRTLGTPRATFLAALIALWNHPVTLHDPLTLLTLCDDCVCFEEKRIEVGVCGAERGFTLETRGEPNCRVAVDVDVERAVSGFLQRALK